jgi:hypothetical protein
MPPAASDSSALCGGNPGGRLASPSFVRGIGVRQVRIPRRGVKLSKP